LIVVHTVASRLQAIFGVGIAQRPGYRGALIEGAILLNAALTAYTLQHALGGRTGGALQASYGVYVISTRRIWAPHAGSADCDGLARPPADASGLPHPAGALIRPSRRFAAA